MKTQSTPLKAFCKQKFDQRFVVVHWVKFLTWVLSVGVSIYYTVHKPRDGSIVGKRIWDQNFEHETGLTMDSKMVNTYWVAVLAMQFVHIIVNAFGGSKDVRYITIGIHYSANNLLHVMFLVLFVRSAFGWAGFILVINFVNLSVLYFQHNSFPYLTRIPIICGPLAWTFIAIFWNWAIAIRAGIGYNDTIKAVGFIFMWAILGYGVFHLLIFKDGAMASLLAYLCASIAVSQCVLQHRDQMWMSPVITASLLVIMMF